MLQLRRSVNQNGLHWIVEADLGWWVDFWTHSHLDSNSQALSSLDGFDPLELDTGMQDVLSS